MPSIHCGENSVGAGLEGKMQIWHQLFFVAMERDQIVVHVPRMARRVADALDRAYLGEALDQLRQRPGPAVGSLAMIGVDVLTEQRQLTHA